MIGRVARMSRCFDHRDGGGGGSGCEKTQSLRSAILMFRTTSSLLRDCVVGERWTPARPWNGSASQGAVRLRQPGYLGSRPVALRPRLATGVPVRYLRSGDGSVSVTGRGWGDRARWGSCHDAPGRQPVAIGPSSGHASDRPHRRPKSGRAGATPRRLGTTTDRTRLDGPKVPTSCRTASPYSRRSVRYRPARSGGRARSAR